MLKEKRLLENATVTMSFKSIDDLLIGSERNSVKYRELFDGLRDILINPKRVDMINKVISDPIKKHTISTTLDSVRIYIEHLETVAGSQ